MSGETSTCAVEWATARWNAKQEREEDWQDPSKMVIPGSAKRLNVGGSLKQRAISLCDDLSSVECRTAWAASQLMVSKDKCECCSCLSTAMQWRMAFEHQSIPQHCCTMMCDCVMECEGRGFSSITMGTTWFRIDHRMMCITDYEILRVARN